jgi:uncharacterized protein DUF4328
MSELCWSCRQRPPAMPDGRCQACSGVPQEAMPTQAAPPPAGMPAPPPAGMPGPPPQGAPGVPGQPYPQYPQQQPPQYAQYPQGPGGPNPLLPAQFTSPRGLGTALTVLLSVCIGFWSIGVLAGGGVSGALSDVEDGTLTSISEYNDANDFYAGSNVFQVLCLIGTGIVFVIWFHRSRVNAEVFEPGGQRMSRGWAAGGWFVPVINFWFPKQIANDIWRSSTPWGANPGRGLLNAWWVLWLITSVVTGISNVLGNSGETIDDQEELDSAQGAVAMNLLGDLTGIAAAILALLFVRKLTARQLTKYQQGPQAPQTPPGPAPYGPTPYG